MAKTIRKSASTTVLPSIIVVSIMVIATNTSATNHDTIFAQSAPYNNTAVKFKSFLDNFVTKKIHVEDIDMAYKIFGKGHPILLIAGTSATMDFWDPLVLRQLSANHTVIVFDNRGMGNTSAGSRQFSISQFANDTAGLLDAFKIREPVDVLAHSLGTFIAQELALMHPDKVNKLVLFASNCGGKEVIPATPEATRNMTELSKVGEQSKQYPSLIASGIPYSDLLH